MGRCICAAEEQPLSSSVISRLLLYPLPDFRNTASCEKLVQQQNHLYLFPEIPLVCFPSPYLGHSRAILALQPTEPSG